MCGNRRARRCGAANTYRAPLATYTSNKTDFTHEGKQDTGIINLVAAINNLAINKAIPTTGNNTTNPNPNPNPNPQIQTYLLDEKKHFSPTPNPPAYSEHATPTHLTPSTTQALNFNPNIDQALISTPQRSLLEPFTTSLLRYRAGDTTKKSVKRAGRDLLNRLYEVEVMKREGERGERLGCKERKGIWRGVKVFKGEMRELVREVKRERRERGL